MTRDIQPFAKHDATPELAPGVEGVAIAVSSPPSALSSKMLHGICRASEQTTQQLADTILHNVTIVGTFGPDLVPFAFPLIRDQVVFAEDVHKEGGYQTAFYNIDLSTCGLPPYQNPYFVLAAFHTFLSETIRFDWSK